MTSEPGVNPQTVDQAPLEKDQTRDIEALLKRYGIATMPNVVYEWGGYRYSNATDAIAAAKRAGAA